MSAALTEGTHTGSLHIPVPCSDGPQHPEPKLMSLSEGQGSGAHAERIKLPLSRANDLPQSTLQRRARTHQPCLAREPPSHPHMVQPSLQTGQLLPSESVLST